MSVGNEVPHELLVGKENRFAPGAPQSLQTPPGFPRRPAPLGAPGRALRPARTVPGVALRTVAHSCAANAAAAAFIAASVFPDSIRRQVPILINSPGGAHTPPPSLRARWTAADGGSSATGSQKCQFAHSSPLLPAPGPRPFLTPSRESVGFRKPKQKLPALRPSLSLSGSPSQTAFRGFFSRLTWRASPTTAISCQDFIVDCKVPPAFSPGEHGRSPRQQRTAPTC